MLPRVLSRLLMLGVLLWCPAITRDTNAAEQEPIRLRIITNSFILPGKITKIASFAEPMGIDVEAVNVDRTPGEPASWLEAADLVILDTPRPRDRATVRGKLGPALETSGAPWLQIGGGRPEFGKLSALHARSLMSYYAEGGEVNLKNMLSYVAAWRRGQDVARIPTPVSLPVHGFYHPEAPSAFAGLPAYLEWGWARWSEAAPMVAIAIHANTLGSMQTHVVDALITGAERRGMIPLVFWFDAAEPRALQDAFAAAKPDVLVNLQHMQNGSARSEEFKALGIPVLQALSYRMGDRKAWRAAESGVPMHMVAPFLSVTESWGMSDPMVVQVVEDGEPVPIPEQLDALLAKAAALAALRRTPAAEKRLALMFWNHPSGEKNLSASHLNVPRSLERVTAGLAAAGYDVPETSEAHLIETGQAMLAGYYRPETLDDLLAEGAAGTIPLAQYRKWLESLPEERKSAVQERWGRPEDHWALRDIDGSPHFVIPMVRLGNLTIMPQPPRGGRPNQSYHDTKLPPDHLYLAAYLLLRENLDVHALIHFGTHGTQEWTPGKDRGLWVGDFPFLAVGDIPVFYPYIQDNIGEAIQARRRGRAVTISHQTPSFAPAGLYDELRDIHELIHEYGQLVDGAVRDKTAEKIQAIAKESKLGQDVGWDDADIERDFDGFMAALHDHLHEVAQSAMPLGLHTFGEPAAPEQRISTVMQQLGETYYQRIATEPDELFVRDFKDLQKTSAYRTLERHLRGDASLEEVKDPLLREMLERAEELDRNLTEPDEIEALLTGLAGGFVPPGSGGDPIRNPEVPSGRNLYAFEPDKIPTRAAYEAGEEALQKLIDDYRAGHDGKTPAKLAFSLWSSEALRHLGVLESQVLYALGLRPVWDKGGLVRALEVIPSAELGRPRIDVVVQVTSVYRDQFDGFMRKLASAIEEIARLEEAGNAVAANVARVSSDLAAKGIPAERALNLASLRIFSNAPGDYGTGVPDMTLDSTHWDSDAAVAEQFLSRQQYAYGAREWGYSSGEVNLFSEQLKGVEAAILARSSRLHGMLSTDHPFEYLGGLALAVRHLDGESPALYVADLRERKPRIKHAARFISDEMRALYLNPHWITEMKKEGYAGTLQILDAVNNLWGWQVMAPETVRADQWQAVHDTFVNDIRDLELQDWFDEHNAVAQAQLIERMFEAIRKGYWDAGDETRKELAARWQVLAAENDLSSTPTMTADFIEQVAAGYGLGAAAAVEAASPSTPNSAAPDSIDEPGENTSPETVRGQVLEPAETTATKEDDLSHLVWLAILGLCLFAGAVQQAYSNKMMNYGATEKA